MIMPIYMPMNVAGGADISDAARYLLIAAAILLLFNLVLGLLFLTVDKTIPKPFIFTLWLAEVVGVSITAFCIFPFGIVPFFWTAGCSVLFAFTALPILEAHY